MVDNNGSKPNSNRASENCLKKKDNIPPVSLFKNFIPLAPSNYKKDKASGLIKIRLHWNKKQARIYFKLILSCKQVLNTLFLVKRQKIFNRLFKMNALSGC